jgi:hypothetical protein
MAIERLLSFIFRGAELAFAAIVAGVNGEYLHVNRAASSWSLGRFIYTETVAGVAIFFSLIWLIPFTSTLLHWPLDLVISLCWWAAFGLLVDLVGDTCGAVFYWGNVAPLGDFCGKTKAVIAFTFLSAVVWLASAILGFFFLTNRERRAARADVHSHRRRWHRRSHV